MSNELNSLEKRLDAIEVLVKELAERIKKIESNLSEVPFTPDIPTSPFNPVVPWMKNCKQCGIKLDQTMGYVCPQPNCPTGLGGVWCGNNPLV